MDGDGDDDEVRLLLDGSDADEPAEGTLETRLGSGEVRTADVPIGYAPDALTAAPIDDAGRREYVLLEHTQGGDSAQLLVYGWVGDALVQLRAPRRVPLMLELDGEGRVADWFVGDRGLVSWLRREPVDGAVHRVDLWSWGVEGDRLVPVEDGQACVDVTSEDRPRPC